MRLFTAIDLPDDLVDTLDRLIDRLRPTARIKWSPINNLHITLKFIGHRPDGQREELKRALNAIAPRAEIAVEISGLGFFPNERSPRVFWAGVKAPPALAGLAGDLDGALAGAGVAPEDRAYSPHLTLARIREPAPLEKLRSELLQLPSSDFGKFVAKSFFLYLSKPGPKGSVYTKLAEFPFTK
ncbi:MAG: RNA 2',3'-cyclic phosphodiesterase [Bryobacteraceae bacterium]